MAVLTLNGLGIIGALALAALLWFLGGGVGWLFVLLMVYFLVLAFVATITRIDYKEKRRFTQRKRGIVNVAANGAAPLAFALVFFIGSTVSNNVLAVSGFFGFFGAVAAITADKFASELGVLDGMPVDILTLRPSKKGRSGAVTWFGFSMAAIAAVAIALAVLPVGAYGTGLSLGGVTPLLAFAAVAVSGFAGNLVDSVAGHFEELGMGNKHTSNLICSIVGGLIAILLVLVML